MLVLLSLLDHGILAAEVGKVEDEDQIDSENIDLSPNLNPEVRAYAENPRTEEAKNDDEVTMCFYLSCVRIQLLRSHPFLVFVVIRIWMRNQKLLLINISVWMRN